METGNTRTELRAAFRAELRRLLEAQRADLMTLAARSAAVDSHAARELTSAARDLAETSRRLR